MPVLIICGFCKKSKPVSPSAVRDLNFCDNACRGQYLAVAYSGEGHPQYRGASITILCEECGDPRTDNPARFCGDHFFCSSACANAWNGRRNRGEDNPRWLGGDRATKQRHLLVPMNRLNQAMSNSIRIALAGSKEGRHWESLVKYTLLDLRNHIESLFTPGMTWGNRGIWRTGGPLRWHIDHIRPQSSFSFLTAQDPEFMECWKLANLQPLWGPENLKKWAHYPYYLDSGGRDAYRPPESVNLITAEPIQPTG